MQSTPHHAARVLGLGLEATLEDVRAVRRKMALKYHPDCSDDQERATRHMARINAAADTLTAYLKDKGAFHVKAARARHSTTRQARPSAQRAETPKSKQAEKAAQTHASKTTQRKAEQHVAPASKPSPSDKAWKAERALARFATESYLSILNGIGRSGASPTVDVKVLNFAPAG